MDEPEYIPEYIHELGKNSRAAQRALRAALNSKEKLHTEIEREGSCTRGPAAPMQGGK